MTKEQRASQLSKNVEVVFIKESTGDVRKGIFRLNEDVTLDHFKTDAISVNEATTGAFKAIKASSILSINGQMV